MSKIYFALFFSILSVCTLFSQSIQWEELAPMPEKVANNALAMATVNGVPFVFSFSGIDTTKSCDGDHLRSFRYNTMTNEWDTIAALPDDLGGKIAAGASTVKNKVYIVGGYHLASNCNEVSSGKIHIYNPETNTYEADGATIPKAIDDQVQAVWKDSLIYVISGWSNTNNVTDVQIYNPTTNEWSNGTPIPNNANWRVFGASGTIIGDTIYFSGGAGNWNGSTFPSTLYFRKGFINPDDPTDITWEGGLKPLSRGYRMGASEFEGKPIWIGGSDVTYNFDGIAYNGTGGVDALDRITFYDLETEELNQIFGFIPAQMDLRGVAKISDNEFIIAGGMVGDQEVTNKVIKITIDQLTDISELSQEGSLFFPNPVKDQLYYSGDEVLTLKVYDALGKLVLTKPHRPGEIFSVKKRENGIYFLEYEEEGRRRVQKIIVSQ